MDREQIARSKHKNGSNCANAVYSSFSDLVTGTAPVPRSNGGMCGAVLAGEQVLRELGKDTSLFDDKFLEKYGSLKCAELRKAKSSCNDLVGYSALLVEEGIG